MRQRVAEARVARLGTVTVDGHPHLVPCCFALDGELLYSAVDGIKSKTTTALRRLDNIRLHPDVAVLVDHYDDDWSTLWWIRIDGHARVLEPGSPNERHAIELLAEKYQQYQAQPIPGPVIAVEISHWLAWP